MSSTGKEEEVVPSSGGGGGRSPCAACQHLEHACGPECVFAPHFPAGDDPARFARVHAAFGADNVARFLGWTRPEFRAEAVHCLVLNAAWRLAVTPSAAAAPSSGGATAPQPCAACRHLQLTCVPGCVFAPHFPAGEDPARFAALHARFGANDVALILCSLSPNKQTAAVRALLRLAQQPTASAAPSPPPPLEVRRRPCAACKYFRRRCAPDCLFRPYYPPNDDPKRFSAVHAVYGTSNLARWLREVPPELRGQAATWSVYEARRRLRDPVLGVTGDVLILETLRKMLEKQLADARKELAPYIGVEAATRSFVPAHVPQPQMVAANEQQLEERVRAAAQLVMLQVKADAAAGVTQFVTPLHEKWVKEMTPFVVPAGSSTSATAPATDTGSVLERHPHAAATDTGANRAAAGAQDPCLPVPESRKGKTQAMSHLQGLSELPLLFKNKC